MITLTATGTVTTLTIVDSACVESNGTYNLIFTGANTTPATGTYTILGNVITAVVLTDGGSGYAAAPTVATQSSDGSVTATFFSLATKQDDQSRHPLVEIVSSQRNADIPFDGSFMTSETFNEYGANVIAHSTDRLCIAYCYGKDADDDCGIKYVYTNVDRTEFITVTIELYTDSSYVMNGVSICEMSDGNIGLVYLVNDTGNHVYRLLRRIVTVTGVAVSNAEIANWSHDTFTSDPWVQTIGANSYYLVYSKKSGSDYFIYKRTSSDFATWSAESALSIAGLTSTWRLANPSLVSISTGDLWLFFDVLESTGAGGEELTNIYYSVSANSGTTWGTAVKFTNYTAYSEVAAHPVAVQKVANSLHTIFTRKVGAMHMNETATGWPTGNYSYTLSWDSVNRKLYVINANPGNITFQSIVRIDVDTWVCEKYWDLTTTPAIPAWVENGIGYSQTLCDSHHIVIYSGRYMVHLDGEEDTITQYTFDEYSLSITPTPPGYGLTVNTTPVPKTEYVGLYISAGIGCVQISEEAKRIYLVHMTGRSGNGFIWVGYVDLTPATTYEYHAIIPEMVVSLYNIYSSNCSFYIDEITNTIVISSWDEYYGGCAFCRVYDLTSGALIKSWASGDSDFPYHGITKPFIYNNKIYGGMRSYIAQYGQTDFRGFCEIDMSSYVIKLYRPSYCSNDDHAFGRPFLLQDGKLAMTHLGYGVSVFNTLDQTWEIFGNSNIAGFTTDGVELSAEAQIQYDDANDLVMVGDAANKGIIMFSIHGYIRQSYYKLGTYAGGAWTFADATALCRGYLDYDTGACKEPDSSTSMYVFWTNEDVLASKSIKWDKDGSATDISKYLVDEVGTDYTISGQPAQLNFTVSDGHLFDPYNTASLLSPILKKGRKLSLRWGEKINITDYWQNSGVFYVTENSLEFQRGQYPLLKVRAEDQRCLWAHGHVYATDVYNNLPEDIIIDLLYDQAHIPLAEMNIPAFAGGTNLQMQWIETTLDEILTQICERFGYYFRFDYNGYANVKLISNVASIDHIYSDNTKLLQYTPDDKYSDFTNRVTVKGQELDFTEVQYAEETMKTLTGTIGWWGQKPEILVWFSEDHSRRAIYPRLNVIETSMSFALSIAGKMTEELIPCGPLGDDKFCTVKLSAPNLTPILIAQVNSLLSCTFIPDTCVVTVYEGFTIRVGTAICNTITIFIAMILSAVANYQLEVRAIPLGKIRRSVQGTWDDLEHQSEIYAIVEQTIDDPLCYSVADCTAVANFEGMVAQMQRKRIMIRKVAHLQDEEGDTIRVIHPYSGRPFDIYIASLKRTFKKADGSNSDGFFDEIEGWVID